MRRFFLVNGSGGHHHLYFTGDVVAQNELLIRRVYSDSRDPLLGFSLSHVVSAMRSLSQDQPELFYVGESDGTSSGGGLVP